MEENKNNSGALSEKLLWALIAMANWKTSPDDKRIEKFYQDSLSIQEQSQLREFVFKKKHDLHNKFEDAWLGKDGGEGIRAGDDAWSDILCEVIARGQKFYENVTVKELRRMADEEDYKESFMYAVMNIG